MAVVAVVQAWLPHPAGAVVRRQVTMVAAERWREQRVLLAAYTQCPDKHAPYLRVAGHTWSISPAGTDPYGMWGIHVAGAAEQAAAMTWLEQTAGSVRDALPEKAKRITDKVIASAGLRAATAEFLDVEPPRPPPAAASSTITPAAPAPRRAMVNAKTLPYGSGSMTDLRVANESALTEEDARRDARHAAVAGLLSAHSFDDHQTAVLLHLARHGGISANEVVGLVGTDAPEVWMNVLGRTLAARRIHVVQRDDQRGPEACWRWVG